MEFSGAAIEFVRIVTIVQLLLVGNDEEFLTGRRSYSLYGVCWDMVRSLLSFKLFCLGRSLIKFVNTVTRKSSGFNSRFFLAFYVKMPISYRKPFLFEQLSDALTSFMPPSLHDKFVYSLRVRISLNKLTHSPRRRMLHHIPLDLSLQITFGVALLKFVHFKVFVADLLMLLSDGKSRTDLCVLGLPSVHLMRLIIFPVSLRDKSFYCMLTHNHYDGPHTVMVYDFLANLGTYGGRVCDMRRRFWPVVSVGGHICPRCGFSFTYGRCQLCYLPLLGSNPVTKPIVISGSYWKGLHKSLYSLPFFPRCLQLDLLATLAPTFGRGAMLFYDPIGYMSGLYSVLFTNVDYRREVLRYKWLDFMSPVFLEPLPPCHMASNIAYFLISLPEEMPFVSVKVLLAGSPLGEWLDRNEFLVGYFGLQGEIWSRLRHALKEIACLLCDHCCLVPMLCDNTLDSLLTRFRVCGCTIFNSNPRFMRFVCDDCTLNHCLLYRRYFFQFSTSLDPVVNTDLKRLLCTPVRHVSYVSAIVNSHGHPYCTGLGDRVKVCSSHDFRTWDLASLKHLCSNPVSVEVPRFFRVFRCETRFKDPALILSYLRLNDSLDESSEGGGFQYVGTPGSHSVTSVQTSFCF